MDRWVVALAALLCCFVPHHRLLLLPFYLFPCQTRSFFSLVGSTQGACFTSKFFVRKPMSRDSDTFLEKFISNWKIFCHSLEANFSKRSSLTFSLASLFLSFFPSTFSPLVISSSLKWIFLRHTIFIYYFISLFEVLNHPSRFCTYRTRYRCSTSVNTSSKIIPLVLLFSQMLNYV